MVAKVEPAAEVSGATTRRELIFHSAPLVNGVDLPHLAKRAFRDQMGPNAHKAMSFGSPPYQGLKNCELSQKKIFFFIFRPFLGPTGVIFAVSALPAMLLSWHTS